MSQHCLNHAPAPIAIIHPSKPRDSGTRERVVVGIDGSDTAHRALQWAVTEADLRVRVPLEVIHAWHPLYVGGYPYTAAAYDPTAFEDAARFTLDSAMRSINTAKLPQPPDGILTKGSASSVILDAAKGADLVVLGSRGLGGFGALLLGSVSHQVAHHATCPVVVVPPEE